MTVRQCGQGLRISTDLELEGVAGGPPAKVSVPNGAVVDVLLSEGSCGGEASVVGQRGAPAFDRAVGRHGHQHHLAWMEKVEEVMNGFSQLLYITQSSCTTGNPPDRIPPEPGARGAVVVPLEACV